MPDSSILKAMNGQVPVMQNFRKNYFYISSLMSFSNFYIELGLTDNIAIKEKSYMI